MSTSPNTAFLNQTVDDTSSTFQYQGAWTLNGTWSAPSLDQSGTLSSSNDPNAMVEFLFPIPAIAFYYFGMQRSRGGLYQICIDCNFNQPDWITIDALNRADNGQNPPIVLFSQTFNTAAVHRVTIQNQNDTRVVPSGNSQITVDRFVLEVIEDSPSTPTGTTTPTQTPFPVSQLPGLSTGLGSVHSSGVTTLVPLTVNPNSSALPATSVSTSRSDHGTSSLPPEAATEAKKSLVGPIIGGVLGFTILSVILAFLGYRRLLGPRNTKNPLPGSVSKLSSTNLVRIRPYMESAPSPPLARHGDPIRTYMDIQPVRKAALALPASRDINYSLTSSSHSQPSSSFSATTTPPASTKPTSTDATTATGEATSRREIDGGALTVIRSVGWDEGVEVLPPAYGQIFGR